MRRRCCTRGARRRGRRGRCCHRCQCLHGRFVRRQFGLSDRRFFVRHRWHLFIIFDLLFFLNLLWLYRRFFGRLRRCRWRWGRRLFPSYRPCLIVCLVYYCLVFLFDIVVWAGRRCCGCRCRHVRRRVVATWWWRLWRRSFCSFFTLYFTLKYTLYINFTWI